MTSARLRECSLPFNMEEVADASSVQQFCVQAMSTRLILAYKLAGGVERRFFRSLKPVADAGILTFNPLSIALTASASAALVSAFKIFMRLDESWA